MPGKEIRLSPLPTLSHPMELELWSHSLRQRPTRRRYGWSTRKPGRRSNRRSARPPPPSPNVAALSRKRDACNFCRARLARSRASCSGLTGRTRRRAIRSPRASLQRRYPKASTDSPTAASDADLAALGFLLALYRYDRFKADRAPKPQLIAPDAVDGIRIPAHRGGDRLRTRSRQHARQRAWS